MSDMTGLKIAMIEMNSSNVKDLGLEGKSYGFASEVLRRNDFQVFYESRTSVLTQFQRELYELVLSTIPKELALLLDPIVVSFALKDACDYSGVDYVWLDLEGDDEVASSAWVRKDDQKEVLDLAIKFLKRHLEKYILDAYDRCTREDMARVWEAQIMLEACPVCGSSSLERRLVVMKKQKLRGWTCTDCGNDVIIPSDVLEMVRNGKLLNEEKT